MWNVRPWYLFRHSLVVRVSVRAGAGLAVLRGANSGVAEEAGGAQLAELPLGVVQAALGEETHHVQTSDHLHNVATAQPVSVHTVQMPVSGWQESECPLHSQSSQWPRYKPPPVRVYPGAQS